jgi:DNA anti-recombination protein RmuC
MGKARFILTMLFVLTLSSGVVAGILVSRWPAGQVGGTGAPTTTAPAVMPSPLVAELELTPQQAEQMKVIWQAVQTKVDDCFLRAQSAQKQREEAIVALLTDEQKAKLAAAEKEYESSLARLKAEREKAFNDAVAKTKQMLSESQRQRYQEILQKRLGGHGAPDWMGPSSVPATGPG